MYCKALLIEANMNHNDKHLDALVEIRSLMNRSTRFLSLSGLSGVFAGTVALAGAAMVYLFLGISPLGAEQYLERYNTENWGMKYETFLVIDAILVATIAFAGGFFFTWRKSRKEGYKLIDQNSIRLAINLAIPFATGGLFCLIILFKHGYVSLVAPATLVFYGLTLLNASKYTYDDIRYLGISEIILGLLATWYVGYGILFWAIGFGVLHILYGTKMYFKYDRKN